MVFVEIQWYSQRFNGIRRDSMVFNGIHRDSMVFNGIHRDSMVFNGIRRDSMVFSGIRRDSGSIWVYLGLSILNILLQYKNTTKGQDQMQ